MHREFVEDLIDGQVQGVGETAFPLFNGPERLFVLKRLKDRVELVGVQRMRREEAALGILPAVFQHPIRLSALGEGLRLKRLGCFENVFEAVEDRVRHHGKRMSFELPGVALFILGDLENDLFLRSCRDMNTEGRGGSIHSETLLRLLRCDQFGLASFHGNGAAGIHKISLKPVPAI